MNAPSPRFPQSISLHIQALGFLTFVLIIALAAWPLDTRWVEGVNPWLKPIKFAASLLLHLATTLVFILFLQPAAQRAWQARWAAWGLFIFAMAEMGYIAFQAARGRSSHFNQETMAEIIAYGVMGFGAVTLVIAPLLLIPLLRHQTRAWVGPNLRLGMVLGLSLSAALTLVTAGFMSSGGGPFVGAGSKAVGLPIVGWSTEVGDIRVSHFFATHLLQTLPLVGWLTDRYGTRTWLWAVTGLGITVTILTFVQALMGQPFIRVT